LVGADLPDVKLSLDSLGVMEEAMRHFYIKAMIEKSAGEHADWKAVDAAMIQASSIARCAIKRRSTAGRKDWLSTANGAVLTVTSGAERTQRSCPAGVIALVGLRWCGVAAKPNGGSHGKISEEACTCPAPRTNSYRKVFAGSKRPQDDEADVCSLPAARHNHKGIGSRRHCDS
jgi:hypothetical protein